MLPLPLLLPIALLIGASGFRLRGDAAFQRWTGSGATTARLVCWALPMGVLAWVAGHPLTTAALIGLGMFVGCLAPWWHSLTLGRSKADGGALGQYARHAARGMLWTAPAAALLAVDWIAGAAVMDLSIPHAIASSGALVVLAGGLACVPAYELGWRLRPYGNLLRPGATEVGEAVFGAALAAAVVVSA